MKRGPANNLFIEQQSVIKLAAWVVKHTNIMSMNFLLSLELIQISTFNSLNKLKKNINKIKCKNIILISYGYK